ncbi:MAG TPA: NAD-dependent epimerase/dehydratase family protein [Fimbriimonadaceae bacterium]|nr:NAD-dependent epimerase/dehydratase family protein [Fimbriimonadaceae bacterium]
MNILVLGGTVFVGRAIVAEALKRGHGVTLFHRGQRGADLFPGVERVLGDRDGDLSQLQARSWDAVIDTCGYHPRVVRHSAEALRNNAGKYLFISTISVYADDAPAPLTEESKLDQFDHEPQDEAINGDTYGPFKVQCEEVVRDVYQDRAQIVRPGLVIGPFDPTDRFTYWPVRMAGQAEVLVPAELDQPSQWIDTRDLANLTLNVLEKEEALVVNASGPEHTITLGQTLERIREVANPGCRFVQPEQEFLDEHGVEPWKDLPLAFPAGDSGASGMVSIERALGHGLSLRPLEDTVRDLMYWWETQRRELKAGLTVEREAELLALLAH